MNKKVWLINHYATDFFRQHGGRHFWMASNLSSRGYQPLVICANTIHNSKDVIDTQNKRYCFDKADNVEFAFVKTTKYTGNGISRIKNLLGFFFNLMISAKAIIKETGRPDYILASSVHPLTCVAGILIARKYKIPCIAEIRDLWPESIVEFSSFEKNNILIKLLYLLEKWIYNKADMVVFTMEGGYDYIKAKGWDRTISRDKVKHINNGIDLTEFDQNKNLHILEDPDLQDSDIFKIIYTGSIRRVNNLSLILDTAKLLRSNSHIKFLIWGQGDEEEALIDRCRREEIDNVCFKGWVGKKQIPYIVSQADINLLHWKMSPILKYGYSYNKLFEYLAAGKPIFSTVQGGYSILTKNGCGIETLGFEPEDLAAGILSIFGMSEEARKSMGDKARSTSGQYDFTVLTDKLIEIFESIDRRGK